MTKAMPFLQKVILLSYDPRPFRPGLFGCVLFCKGVGEGLVVLGGFNFFFLNPFTS